MRVGFVAVLAAALVVVGSAAAAAPELVTLGTMTIADGSLDCAAPPPVHFLQERGGRFVFRTPVRVLDRDAATTWTGAVQLRLYREEGEVGSENWRLVWSLNREFGDRGRNPRLRDADGGPLDGPLVEQPQPLARWRVEVKASTHGTRRRDKRTGGVVTVVRRPERGPWDQAATLLVCQEAALVYQRFHDVLEGARARKVDRHALLGNLEALRFGLARLDGLGCLLPGSPPTGTRVAWSMTLSEAVRGDAGRPRLRRDDLALPWGCILDRLVLATLAELGDVDHGRAAEACRRALASLTSRGWGRAHDAANLRHELFAAERLLVVDRDSYDASVAAARERFIARAGRHGWPGGPEPVERTLDETFRRAERFFDLPRHVAALQVAVMRALGECPEL